MIIAIDFDGTIAESDSENDYAILDEMPGAIKGIQALRDAGHTTILWTCRGNTVLEEALLWLARRGIGFTYVNENVHPLGGDYFPRKVFAHVYIDDRNLGGFPGWDKVLEELL